MNRTAAHIAIIGAGIGGLALAAVLRRAGIAADIYEQAAAFGHVGAGIQLTANATKALTPLGILPHLRRTGFAAALGYNRMWNTGEATNVLPMGRAIEDRYGSPDLSMHRSVLHFALAELIELARLHLGRKLVGLAPDGDRVRLDFADGGTIVAEAVIGADGLHSVVREALFGAERPRFTGKVAYRTIFPIDRVVGHEVEERVKWWGPDRHVVSYVTTAAQDEVYFIAVVPDAAFTRESWSLVGDHAELLSAFTHFHPRARALLAAAPEVRKWALLDRDPMPSWGEGRVVLLGDACHPMPPVMAQGGASAIEDAVILGRILADGGLDDVARAFERYGRIRRERTAAMQRTTREGSWMRHETDADWVYGYDVWKAPLDAAVPAAALER
ncbi:MAG: salicylate 1-monooxygenase [Alphaproteobacteria bacterium]|nr:salicylate 1-monooxygenase [Alphaproteobacteria bacterium]